MRWYTHLSELRDEDARRYNQQQSERDDDHDHRGTVRARVARGVSARAQHQSALVGVHAVEPSHNELDELEVACVVVVALGVVVVVALCEVVGVVVVVVGVAVYRRCTG